MCGYLQAGRAVSAYNGSSSPFPWWMCAFQTCIFWHSFVLSGRVVQRAVMAIGSVKWAEVSVACKSTFLEEGLNQVVFSEYADNWSLGKALQLSCIFMRTQPAFAKAVQCGTCTAVKLRAPNAADFVCEIPQICARCHIYFLSSDEQSCWFVLTVLKKNLTTEAAMILVCNQCHGWLENLFL